MSVAVAARYVIASFVADLQVRGALARLCDAGVDREEISLLMAEVGHTPRFGVRSARRLAEGVAYGAALGGVLGALAGVSLASAGVLGAGPELGVLTVFASAGLGGGLGSVLGGSFGLGARGYRVELVDGSASDAPILVAVAVADAPAAARIAGLLEGPGAESRA